MKCCMYCHGDVKCMSVNYHENTKTCELNDKASYDEGCKIETEYGWTLYNRLG